MTFVTARNLTAEGAENAEEEQVVTLAADKRRFTLISNFSIQFSARSAFSAVEAFSRLIVIFEFGLEAAEVGDRDRLAFHVDQAFGLEAAQVA